MGAVTATVQYDLWKNVLSRVEFRWDHALDGTDSFGNAGPVVAEGNHTVAGTLKNSTSLPPISSTNFIPATEENNPMNLSNISREPFAALALSDILISGAGTLSLIAQALPKPSHSIRRQPSETTPARVISADH